MVGVSVQAIAPADASDAQTHVATNPAWSRRSATVWPEKTGASDVATARHAQPGTIAISWARLDFHKTQRQPPERQRDRILGWHPGDLRTEHLFTRLPNPPP